VRLGRVASVGRRFGSCHAVSLSCALRFPSRPSWASRLLCCSRRGRAARPRPVAAFGPCSRSVCRPCSRFAPVLSLPVLRGCAARLARAPLWCLLALLGCRSACWWAAFSVHLVAFPAVLSLAPFCPAALAAGFPLVGVSGPRSCSCSPGPCSCGRAACVSAAASFCAALAASPSRPAVAVGCVSGVSAVCRAAFGAPGAVSAPARGGCVSAGGGLSVWAVGSAGFGSAVGRAAFAARSLAFVQSVAAAGGCFVSFLPSPCPPGVSPSAPFSGGGSGSWGSAAAALAAGCASLAFLPASVPGFASSFPARWGGRFAPVTVVPGVGSWWFAPALPPAQPVLFS